MNPGYNTILLSGIVYQKGGLNFFDVFIRDHTDFLSDEHFTTQIRHIEQSKTVLTLKIRLHIPTQHTSMFGTYLSLSIGLILPAIVHA